MSRSAAQILDREVVLGLVASELLHRTLTARMIREQVARASTATVQGWIGDLTRALRGGRFVVIKRRVRERAIEGRGPLGYEYKIEER